MTYTNKELLALSYEFALESPDPSTQNGALVFDQKTGRIVGHGCNMFTRGWQPEESHLERPLKYSLICHAERNAIYHSHEDVRGMTLVCPWAACTECAWAIIESGITHLLRHKTAMDHNSESSVRWGESVALADEMMLAAGVDIAEYEGCVGAAPIWHSGEIWYP